MTRPLIEDGLTVRCGDCNEDKRWEGAGKKARIVCGCAPLVVEPKGRRKCSHKGAKAKGTGEERNAVRAFEGWGWTANRTAGSGAHGSRTNEQAFATDVRVKLGDLVVRVECKRHASIGGVKTFLKLMDNSEVLWLRQDFEEPYVFMRASTLGEIAALAAEGASGKA